MSGTEMLDNVRAGFRARKEKRRGMLAGPTGKLVPDSGVRCSLAAFRKDVPQRGLAASAGEPVLPVRLTAVDMTAVKEQR